MNHMTAREIIVTLNMEPHPEGGWFVQTFRDSPDVSRGKSTCIYYLLEQGQRSHWHRVTDAVEVWHYYSGAPLILRVSHDGNTTEIHHLGTHLAVGERPQVIVPADSWQSAESTGEWTLVGCTVAPGFEFSSFVMAEPDWEPGL